MQNSEENEKMEDLIERAKDGDVHAFKEIVFGYQSYAYTLALRFLYDECDAEDVVQESFIRIWNHLHDFDSKKKFTTWMYAIVVHLCYDKTKSNKRRNRIFERINNHTSELNIPGTIQVEEEFIAKETLSLIQYFAEGLSEKQRMIFLLRDLQGLSMEEVSAITGLSASSIKTNLCYARQSIRKKLVKVETNI
jgi:RNA polymerase sigma-70 factor, ECF subfamily